MTPNGEVADAYIAFRTAHDVAEAATKRAYHSTKFLLRLHGSDIIRLRIEAILRDRLHWCGLLGLG